MLNEPIDSFDLLDPPPSDPPSKGRPLWLRDTLQDVERYILARGTFRESKTPCRYQGYLVAMSTIVQAEHLPLKKL